MDEMFCSSTAVDGQGWCTLLLWQKLYHTETLSKSTEVLLIRVMDTDTDMDTHTGTNMETEMNTKLWIRIWLHDMDTEIRIQQWFDNLFIFH